MRGSMADIQYAMAEIRREKKEKRKKKKPQGKNIMGCPIPQGNHNNRMRKYVENTYTYYGRPME